MKYYPFNVIKLTIYLGLKKRERMKTNKTIGIPCEREEVSYLNQGISRTKSKWV